MVFAYHTVVCKVIINRKVQGGASDKIVHDSSLGKELSNREIQARDILGIAEHKYSQEIKKGQYQLWTTKVQTFLMCILNYLKCLRII